MLTQNRKLVKSLTKSEKVPCWMYQVKTQFYMILYQYISDISIEITFTTLDKIAICFVFVFTLSTGDVYLVLESNQNMVRLEHCASLIVKGLVSRIDLELFAQVASQIYQSRGN